MEVRHKEEKLKMFKDIAFGECFLNCETIYMKVKIPGTGEARRLSLRDGTVDIMWEEALVVPVDAECIWE